MTEHWHFVTSLRTIGDGQPFPDGTVEEIVSKPLPTGQEARANVAAILRQMLDDGLEDMAPLLEQWEAGAAEVSARRPWGSHSHTAPSCRMGCIAAVVRLLLPDGTVRIS